MNLQSASSPGLHHGANPGPRVFIVDDETLARMRMKALLSDISAECPHEVVGEASHGAEALERIAECSPDIVLLDVRMPGMDGIELAALLAKREDPPSVIFITAFDDYALKAFDVQALDYLLKPVRASRLEQAIRRVSSLRQQARRVEKRKNFSVHERGRLLLVPVAEVLYLRADQKYLCLRTLTREFLIEESLSAIEEEFAGDFVRVHRSALVARNAIVGIERGASQVDAEGEPDRAQDSWQVILRDLPEKLPISRRQLAVIKALVR